MSPKITNNQKIIGGKAKNIMARLQPTHADSMPQKNVPHIDPMLLIEANHAICLFVIRPVLRGVSSERRMGKEGESHPTQQPCDSKIILAKTI